VTFRIQLNIDGAISTKHRAGGDDGADSSHIVGNHASGSGVAMMIGGHFGTEAAVALTLEQWNR
jgi:hypothetical protein